MKTSDNIRPFILWVIVISVVWSLSIAGLIIAFPDIEIRAQFGDSFGSVNALFSGVALAGIIYTIILQRKELQLQREELRMTREELKRSATAQEKSEISLSEQVQSMEKSSKLNALGIILQAEVAKMNVRVQKGASGKIESVNIDRLALQIKDVMNEGKEDEEI